MSRYTLPKSRFFFLALAILFAGVACLARWYPRQIAPNSTAQARERAQTPPGMVYVPGGYCKIGTDDADADEDVRPSRRVFVPSFYIDRTEVTNAEYKRFKPTHRYPAGEDQLPVTDVTYAEAEAYAKWAGKRLPTEEEWEKAARGTDGRRYPWGNDWDKSRVAQRAKTTTSHAANPPILIEDMGNSCAKAGPSRVQCVGSLPDGASPYGCLDMAGNAWEWVQGFYQGNPDQRILRGGAVGYGEKACRVYERAIEGTGST